MTIFFHFVYNGAVSTLEMAGSPLKDRNILAALGRPGVGDAVLV